jgi:hypothetical protein
VELRNGQTNAQVIGPSRQKWDANHIEAEAIGRMAVRLNRTGDYVSFTTTRAANSIVVRYSIPDAAGGGGINATLSLYVNGTKVRPIVNGVEVPSLPLTSRYSWSYKGGAIGDPNVDRPAEQPHTFFDEARALLKDIPAGATVMLRRDAEDTAGFYVIDLIDLEQVPPPLTMPAGFRSVTEFGIQPNDGKDHADDILRAMRSTSKLWFPAGTYLAQKITGGNVGLDNPGMEVRGAGMWHTNIVGPKALFFCYGATAHCVFGDFSILGESKARDEEINGVQKAFAGPMGSDSLIENVWIEHVVGAIWVGNDPAYQLAPTNRLTIRNCRIRNTYADGINFDNGTSNSVVENCHLRTTGDDALVVWSIKWSDWVKEKSPPYGSIVFPPGSDQLADQGQGRNNIFRNNTVQLPWRANCFAAYGGAGNVFENSVCEDMLTYPGTLIDNEFSSYSFGPELTVFRNISLIRAGGPMFQENAANPWQHGALKFYLREGDVNDILVENVDIIDPPMPESNSAVSARPMCRLGRTSTRTSCATRTAPYSATSNCVTVTNAGTYGIEVMDGGGRGQVRFDGVVVRGSARGALNANGAPSSFFVKGVGNSGW